MRYAGVVERVDLHPRNFGVERVELQSGNFGNGELGTAGR